MKLLGRELTFNNNEIWHKGNFDPASKVDKAEFDNLEIGGRNLILNGDFSQGLTNWTKTSNDISLEVGGGYRGNGLRLVITNAGTVTPRQRINLELMANDTLTGQVKVKTIQGNFSNMVMRVENQLTIPLVSVKQLDNDWELYTYQVTVSSPITLSNDFGFYNTTGEFIIDEIKLERGNKATDWTPAPEDIQAELDSKAPLASPNFTGVPTAPTAPNGTNTDQIATTKFVQNALSAGGYGDMLKSQYDTDSDGIVDRAETADKLTTARTISLSGDIVGSTIFDGSADISINTIRLIKNNSFILDSLYTFTRSSTAYLSDGTLVNINLPRFEQGKFGKAIMVEEGTTNLVQNGGAEQGAVWWNAYNNGWVIETTIVKWGTKSFRCNTGYYGGLQSPMIAIDRTKPICISFDIYRVVGEGWWQVIFYDGSAVQVGQVGNVQIPSGLQGAWERRTIFIDAASIPSTATQMIVRLLRRGDTTDDVVYDNIQVEQKPYATSFIDGTRAAETLTIPTAGVLNPQEGTVECWVYVNDVVRRNIANNWSTVVLIRKGSSAANWIWLHHNPAGTWTLQIRKEDGTITGSGSFNDNLTPDGWHYFAIRWNAQAGTADLFHNGVKRVSLTGVAFPAEYDRIDVGHRSGGSGDWLNSLIDDLRISNRARTDAEILAAYQSNEPLPYDAYTTWLSRFDNNYGLIGNSSNQIPVSNGILCTNLNAERTNGIKITVSTIAPTSPQINDIWIDLN